MIGMLGGAMSALNAGIAGFQAMQQNTQHGGKYQRFYGKYRGIVLDNYDLYGQGRIIAEVEAIPGSITNYAMPCTPYAGDEVGFFFMPPIGANVWIEFERGDPNFPIWSGCFWTEFTAPYVDPLPELKIIKTDNCNMIFDDTDGAGGFILEVNPPATDDTLSIIFDTDNITISCPTAEIVMTSDTITLEVPDAEITLAADTISALVPDANIEMTSASISAEVPSTVVALTDANVTIETTELEAVVDSAVTIEVPDIEIVGDITLQGAVDITGDFNVTGAAEVEGDINGLGAFEVEGEANFLGEVSVEGNETVIGLIEGVVI